MLGSEGRKLKGEGWKKASGDRRGRHGDRPADRRRPAGYRTAPHPPGQNWGGVRNENCKKMGELPPKLSPVFPDSLDLSSRVPWVWGIRHPGHSLLNTLDVQLHPGTTQGQHCPPFVVHLSGRCLDKSWARDSEGVPSQLGQT